jgi:peptidoglycan/xylan/chitin deacetylase (PgdA/CDA1 family)
MKEIVKTALAITYAAISSVAQKKPYRIVMCYHSIKKQDIGSFEKQMAYLASNCKVVKASEILTASMDGVNPIAAITFDDAFVSVFENALPVLREYGLPASIFVPTGNLGQPPRWNISQTSQYENDIVINEKQLREVNENGFELLSHTVSHPVLTELDDNTLKTELSNSKSALEKMLDHEVCGISYPHGVCDSRVCNAVKQAGYRLGFTIEPNIVNTSTDIMQIGRVAVSPKDSLIKFKLKVKGAYQASKYLSAIKKSLFTRPRRNTV